MATCGLLRRVCVASEIQGLAEQVQKLIPSAKVENIPISYKSMRAKRHCFARHLFSTELIDNCTFFVYISG